MKLEKLLGIWRLASRWGMCLGIGVWSIIGGGMKENKRMSLFSKFTTKKLKDKVDFSAKIIKK